MPKPTPVEVVMMVANDYREDNCPVMAAALDDAAAALHAAAADAERLRARPIDTWHEDDGPALWWCFPVDEAPYSGSPLDTEWPGYHTHWTPIVVPEAPRAWLSPETTREGDG